MKFTVGAIPALWATLAIAAPPLLPMLADTSVISAARNVEDCLSESTAKQVAADYASLIGAYTEAKANAMLTDDFSEMSDSINIIAHKPLGSVTFPTKKAFMDEVVYQPAIPMDVTSIDAYSCNVVALRWTQTFGPPRNPKPVAGISTLFMKKVGDQWRFEKIFVEFNSITYFMNSGGHCGLD